MEEFDIEKVESLDFDTLEKQLKYIFKEEQDIVNFVNFLRNISNFVNLSNDKRHMNLIHLGYFKSQILLYENRIKALIDKRKNMQTKQAIKKAKTIGEKITDNTIIYCSEEDSSLDGLTELYNLTHAWSTYMQDLYFMVGQTNKNLGGFQ